jgi:hypothetical protein
MSKKSRRNRAKDQASGKKVERGKVAPIVSSKSTTESKIPVPPVAHKTSPAKVFQYGYVASELRNIGIIAGALIIVLIILTFILG